MEASKVPFISARGVKPTLRYPLRQYRPRCTQPWVLLLFLVATSVCFGMLVAVSLIDKQTSLSTDAEVTQLVERHQLHHRQQSNASTTVSLSTSAVLSLTAQASSASSRASATASSKVLSLTSVASTATASAGLSLTSQKSTISSTVTASSSAVLSLVPPTVCYVTATVTQKIYTATVGSGDITIETAAAPTPSTPLPSIASCQTLTIITPQSLILSLTSQTSPRSSTTTVQFSTTNQLSLTSKLTSTTPYATNAITSTPSNVATLSASVQLSLTLQSSADSPGATLSILSVTSATTHPLPTPQATTVSQIVKISSSDATLETSVVQSASPTTQLLFTSSVTTRDKQGSTLVGSTTQSGFEFVSATSTINGAISSTVTEARTALLGASLESDTSLSPLSSTPLTSADKHVVSVSTSSSHLSIGGAIVLLATIDSTTIDGSTLLGTLMTITTMPVTGTVSSTVTLTANLVPIETAADYTVFGVSVPGTTIAQTTIPPTIAASVIVGARAVSITNTANPTLNPSSGFNSSTAVDPAINNDLVLLRIDFHKYDYFLAVYLPKIVAVIMACLWSIIFASLKLMEPFYRLSAKSGAFGKEALFGNYLSSEINLSSLSAMFQGQWLLILGGIALLAWAAVVALTSEAMLVISKGTCRNEDGTEFRCDPGWAVDLPILKTLLVLLCLIFVLTSIMAWIVFRRRRSGVFVDPSSIAAMAELMGNPDVMQDLRDINPTASDNEVAMLLAENRYKLGFYDMVSGKETHSAPSEAADQRWGLIKLSGDVAPRPLSLNGRLTYGAVPNPSIDINAVRTVDRKRRILQTIFDAVMLLTELTIFAVVLAYYLDGKSDPFNDFFNSNRFGPRFVLTALALILSGGWRATSQEVTLMAPYRNMARALRNDTGVPGKRSILAATACTPFTAFHRGLVLRNYLIAAVAMSAVLSEVLLVAVSGVPFNTGQIKPSLQASTFVSLGILFIMALTTIAVIVHRRTSAGGTRRLPRSPNTLAGVWIYLCGSGLAQHDQGHGDGDGQIVLPLDQEGLVAKYSSGNYGFACAVGVDGITRWTIDEAAELHSSKPEMLQENRDRQQRPYQLGWPGGSAEERPYTPSAYSSRGSNEPQARSSLRPRSQEVIAQNYATRRRQQRYGNEKPQPSATAGQYLVEVPDRGFSPPPGSNAIQHRHLGGGSMVDTRHQGQNSSIILLYSHQTQRDAVEHDRGECLLLRSRDENVEHGCRVTPMRQTRFRDN